MINLIVCVNNKGVIGRNNDIIYHIHDDMRNFKRLTMGNAIIMGSNTFNSLPQKPLGGRLNIVITRNPAQYKGINDIVVVSSIDDALKAIPKNSDAFVIGGATIYNQFLDRGLIDRAILTEVDDDSEEHKDIKILKPWYIRSKDWILRFQTPYIVDENGIHFRYIIFDKNK